MRFCLYVASSRHHGEQQLILEVNGASSSIAIAPCCRPASPFHSWALILGFGAVMRLARATFLELAVADLEIFMTTQLLST